jgi:hypothetical protein
VGSRSYYDLVAGLPDLSPDAARLPLSPADFVTETAWLVHPEDAELLRLLQLAIDNRNLITRLEKLDRPFAPGGLYDSEALAQEIANPETMPDYLQAYLDAHRSGEPPFPELAPDDRLSWLYCEHATAQENEFVASWFTFERELRNILSALAVRRNLPHLHRRGPEHLKCLESVLIGRTDVEEHLMASAAPDFGLAERLPWIERVLHLPEGDFVERERRLDLLRWDMLDELTTFSYFRIETLLAFYLRLRIVERWAGLDPKTGRDRLAALVQGLKPAAPPPPREGHVFPRPT